MSRPPHHLKKLCLLALLFIILTGTLFRVAGLSSGYQRVDDIPVARQIERNYLGDWRPDLVFFYPNCFDYIVAVGLRVVSAFFRLVGVQREPGLFSFSLDQILFAARLLCALLGSATILIVYGIGARLFSARDGLLASFLFSVAFIHILFSHQIALDVPMTFFYALALYFCALIIEKRRWGDYALAGLMGGLAMATKYNAIFIFVAIPLAHFLSAPPVKKRFLRSLLDRKLYLAGAASAGGFFLGHPYAFFQFRTFLGASRLLLRIVHETEWFLAPIQPKTWIEHIQYNRYFLGLKNILIAEGPLFLALILAGVAAVITFRNKKAAWLALSGLAYFLGALGFLGFSRFRDLPTFAVFYSFLAAWGLLSAVRLLARLKALRPLSVFLCAGVIAVLEFGAWTKSYYLWEDDTTEMAERWIRRNVPAGSYFGKEWFSPSLRGRDYSYPTFNRPYLFARDFPPYSRFDYLLISSAAYGHFFKNEKFYSEPLSLYRSLPRNNELVKDFYFKDIEYSNPELKLFRTKTATKRRQRLALPLAIPLNNPEREFESVDGSPYGKSTMSFFLKGGDIVKRSIISRKKIANLAVFVSGADADGEVVIRNFGRTRRIRVRPGRPELAVFRPRLSFPFYHNIYKVSVRGTESLGSVFVRLCYDEFEIGSEFFARSDWEAARSHFLKALEEKPYSATDLEIYLYLATCCQNLGLNEDARQFLAEAKAIPSFGRFLGLFRDAADEKAWRKDFEKFSGLRLDLFESLQANLIQASEFERLDAREGAAGQESETGAVRTASAVRQYYPQPYKIEAEFLKPSSRRGAAGELEILSRTQETEERQVFPLELNGSPENPTVSVSLVWENRTAEAKTQFIMKTSKDKPLILQQLKIYPDVRRFFGQKEVWVRRLLDSGAGSASEVP